MTALVVLGARTRFAGAAEWLSTVLAALIVVAVLGSLWTAAHPDGALRTQALLGWIVAVSCASRSDEWLITRHLDGRIAVDLARPVGPEQVLLLRDAGRVLAGIAGIGLPIGLLVAVMFPLVGVDAARIAEIAASLALAGVAAHAVALLVATVAVRLGAPAGTTWLKSSVLALLSGAAVPPGALSEPWRSLMLASPFAALAGTPAAIACATAPPHALAIQAAWALSLLGLARLAWRAIRPTLGTAGG